MTDLGTDSSLFPAGVLECPLCQEPLAQTGAALQCARGHSFDLARDGYVNLLTGKPRGDTREMAHARRSFLEQGWYAPLAERLRVLAGQSLADADAPPVDAAPVMLDAGCGEGYYLGHLLSAPRGDDAHVCAATAQGRVYLGLDISKDAIRMAARRHPSARFVVADVTRRLPLATGVVALLLDVFAPRNAAEFARLVAPGGTLLVVIPAPDHLVELRNALSLLGIEPEKERHVAAQLSGSFDLVSTDALSYPMRLDHAAVTSLVAMTPNAWHATGETAAAIAALPEHIAATAAFRVLCFLRR